MTEYFFWTELTLWFRSYVQSMIQFIDKQTFSSLEQLSDWILQAHVFGIASSANAGLSKHYITHKMT